MATRASRAVLLANPGGGRGRVARCLPRLRELARRHDVALEISTDAADLTRRAGHAAQQGIERLLVAGGDGSAHWAIQGLVGNATPRGPATALGMVPLGSGNDLAGTLGTPAFSEESLEWLLAMPERQIDLICVAGAAGDPPRFVAGVVSVGFDSEVNRYANSIRWLRGRAIYVYAVLRILARFRAPGMIVDGPGLRFGGRVMFAVFANGYRYGGGMRIAPDASVDDGLLDVIIVREKSRFELLRTFPRVFSGSHLRHPAISSDRVAKARVSLDRPIDAYGDGERLIEVGARGVEISCVPLALTVLAAPL